MHAFVGVLNFVQIIGFKLFDYSIFRDFIISNFILSASI